MATTDTTSSSWRGQNLIDSDGDKIGKIEEIYLDADTDAARVGAGHHRPVRHQAVVRADRSDATRARATASASRSTRRPSRTPRRSIPTASSPSRRRPSSTATTGSSTPSALGQRLPSAGATPHRASRGRVAARADVSGPNTDDAMTRSEEELRVGTTEREAGRVRLQKYVVEDEVTQTVPVRREEVRVEREPITDANRGDATAGPEISEEEHEVVLHEEEVVAEKRAVPKERVRLEKDVTPRSETSPRPSARSRSTSTTRAARTRPIDPGFAPGSAGALPITHSPSLSSARQAGRGRFLERR